MIESRQTRWQRKQVEAGNCRHCGRPRLHYPTACDACAAKYRERMREAARGADARGFRDGASEIADDLIRFLGSRRPEPAP